MKVDLKETEKTAALLLSGASTYILNTIATLEDKLEVYMKEYEKTLKWNEELKQKINELEVENKRLEDSTKSDPSLSLK